MKEKSTITEHRKKPEQTALLCEFSQQPLEDCYCRNVNGQTVPNVVKFCMGEYRECPIYRRHNRLKTDCSPVNGPKFTGGAIGSCENDKLQADTIASAPDHTFTKAPGEYMTQDSVERLLGRLLTDSRFRADAAAARENASRLEGYGLTKGELNLLARIDPLAFEAVAVNLDPSLCRSATQPSRHPKADKEAL